MWRGWTTPDNADAYAAVLRDDVLPGIGSKGIAGYRGADVLRRSDGDEVEFVTLLKFDAVDDVRALAGDDYQTAYVPAAAREVLARFDKTAMHYETLALSK